MRNTGFIIVLTMMVLTSSCIYYNTEFEIPETREDEKIVYINEDDKFMVSNHNDDDYLSLHVLDNRILGLAGRSLKDYDSFMIDVENQDGENLIREEELINQGNISLGVELDLEPGDYRVIIYMGEEVGQEDDRVLINYVSKMEAGLRQEDGEYSIPLSETYQTNLDHMELDNQVRKKHLSLFKYRDEDKAVFKELVDEILAGEKDDYKKAYLISQWVSENIYYNVDGLVEKDFGVTDAIGTLELGYSVCQGYAELTDALLKTAGIPSRLTSGYGLGGSGIVNESWDDVEPRDTNHIWNEAYIDGRWIIIDTTWNSNNKRLDGEMIKNPADGIYFDVSLEYFSEKHRIDTRH